MTDPKDRIEKLEATIVALLNLIHGADLIDEFQRDDLLKPLGLSHMDDTADAVRRRRSPLPGGGHDVVL